MIIVGTAGHIDHGKTTLVHSLTGIQTDRLKEEKERGISIELGFAYLDLPSGARCGVIDVPGHERFVRQMIAGATGVDVVVLVVAADEGVMQQTREHLDICRLLGVQHGMVVVTKTDLVDDEWLELVTSDIEDFVAGTFLEGKPIVHFSSHEPNTRDDVMSRMDDLAKLSMANSDNRLDGKRPLRMPVDRVFTMHGFGTVITGTVAAGILARGEAIELLPSGLRTKVRGIESHKQSVQEVSAGQRAAVNLQGVDKDHVHRGDVIVHADTLKASRMLDVQLHLLPHVPHPLTTQSKALVHVGTSQITATVALLDRSELLPGDSAPAQLRLDTYVVVLGGDHVVIRGFELLESYGKTLGGGVVLHPTPHRHRSNQEVTLTALEALNQRQPEDMCEYAVRMAGHAGLAFHDVSQVVSWVIPDPSPILGALVTSEKLVTYVDDGVAHYVHRSPFQELVTRATATLDAYHERYPHRPGVPREELRSQIRQELHSRYFGLILDAMDAKGEIEQIGQHVCKRGFSPSLNTTLTQLRADVLKRFVDTGLEPPALSDLTESLCESGVRRKDLLEVIDLLVAQGALIRVQDSLIFAAEHVRAMEEQVRTFLEKNGEMTTPQFKELTRTTRKYTIPIGEYLDAKKVTIRIGDVRKLR